MKLEARYVRQDARTRLSECDLRLVHAHLLCYVQQDGVVLCASIMKLEARHALVGVRLSECDLRLVHARAFALLCAATQPVRT